MAGKMELSERCRYWREIQAVALTLLDGLLEPHSSLGQSTGLRRTWYEEKKPNSINLI